MNYEEASALAKAILESAPKAARKNAKTGFELMMFDFYTTAIECIEKQIPKSGNVGFAKFCECPKCEWIIETLEPFNYCPNCGQAIKWREEE